MIHDSGPDAPGRVVVYGTDECIRVLARADIWFMDGNFKMAPLIFNQLYIIRAPLGTSAVTCVFVFLSNKSQQLHEEMLQVIVDRCAEISFQPHPRIVITDFEQAMFNAVRQVLGEDVQSHGCFYHLTQSTWRKIQELGLTNVYKENNEVQHYCGILNGLAFLPVDGIVQGLAYLRERMPDDLEQLVNYFDATYVSGTFRHVHQAQAHGNDENAPVLLRRVPPRFPPAL